MTDSASFDARHSENVRLNDGRDVQEREAELQALYVSRGHGLARFFRMRGLDDAQAADLVHDVFVLAYRNLAKFKGDSQLYTWVFSIARNALFNHFRKLASDAIDGTSEPVDPDTLTNEDDESLNARCDCVRRAFARFRAEHPERAEALHLFSVEGWTVDELSRRLGRTPNATKEYLSQCRIHLRPYLEDCNEP